MTENVKVILRNARPDNQVHLLLWDTPDENELVKISLYNNALRVNYRENLLQRINPDDRFLALQHNLDGELETIKSMCCGISQEVVLLENLDCLITYLQVQPRSQITLFWKNLEKTRKLEKLLWILLPHQLVPNTWPQERIKQISSG
jgi:hypothetical protein